MKNTQDALILQGGGALGAYEVGVIERLMEQDDFRPSVVTGVSIGAINAAVLAGAREDPLSSLKALWEEFTVAAPIPLPEVFEPFLAFFGNQNFYRLRTDLAAWPFWTSYYDTSPLRGLLEKYIDFGRLNGSDIKVAVTAVNIRTGRVEVFDNHSSPEGLTLDHIMASGSLPPGFPMTQVGEEWYWDGGLFDNTPLKPAIERLDPDPDIQRRLLVVKLFPEDGPVPRNMAQVYDRILEITFSGKLGRDLDTARRVNEYLDFARRVEALLDTIGDPAAAAGIRALPGYRHLQKYMALQQIIPIENKDPEIVTAPLDFSRKRIERRMEAGYRDAKRVLAEMRREAVSV